MEQQERGGFLSGLNETISLTHNLLENLLQWSRSQSGKMAITSVLIDLKDLAFESYYINKQIATQKEITVIIDAPDQTFAVADRNMILTVLRNLLVNAIKHTKSNGTITISAKVANNMILVSPRNEKGKKRKTTIHICGYVDNYVDNL